MDKDKDTGVMPKLSNRRPDPFEPPLPDLSMIRAPKRKPVQGLTVAHSWNTDDFVGKYHIHRFKNKFLATPGTTVVIEEKRNKSKKDDIDRFQKALDDRTKARRNRLKVRYASAKLNCDVEFKTVIGTPMDDIEATMKEKEDSVRSNEIVKDNPKDIKAFFTNIERGNFAYIAYALTLGFKSINVQHPETGDTPLQIAVRAGDIRTVQELMKHCAEPNYRNNKGKSCQHECWSCWKFHHNRTREERLDMEEKTYNMLFTIFSYGGFVDAQDSEGETALHIACRMGPLKVVLLCLAFKGNPYILTKEKTSPNGEKIGGLSPWDYAEMHGRTEFCQLLEGWQNIRHQTVLNDFIVVWRKFLKDYEAVISDAKGAEKIIFDLDMETNITRVGRAAEQRRAKTDRPLIDDVSMRSINEAIVPPPKPRPWDAMAWKAFKEECEDAGMVDHLSELEQEQKKIKDEQMREINSRLQSHKDKSKKVEEKQLTLAQEAAKRLPTIQRRKARPRSAISFRLGSSGSRPTSRTGTENRVTEGKQKTYVADEDDDVITTLEGIQEVYTAGMSEETKQYMRGARAQSPVKQRRMGSAQAVIMDAKFYRYTRRPATSSPMLLSWRTPTAPLDGTEEEASVVRNITDQGKEFDLVREARGKNIRKALGFETKAPPVTQMGDYNTEEVLKTMGERDSLFARVTSKAMSQRESVEAAIKEAKAAAEAKGITKEAAIAEKIELINGKRSRFVEKHAVPPDRKDGSVKEKIRLQTMAEEEEKFKKYGINAANAEVQQRVLQQKILQEIEGDGGATPPPSTDALSSTQKKNAKKDAIRRRMLLKGKKEVKYGANRVTTTHNSFGAIEPPWSTASGRYTTRQGDRTT